MSFHCPKCNALCDRDVVDVGVGNMYGPYGCPQCGWCEDERFDQTFVEQPDDGHIDQWGGFTPE